MAPTIQTLGIDALGYEDRLALAEAIWQRVQPEGLSEELRSELDRRIALADADPSRVRAWEEVRAAVRSKRIES